MRCFIQMRLSPNNDERGSYRTMFPAPQGIFKLFFSLENRIGESACRWQQKNDAVVMYRGSPQEKYLSSPYLHARCFHHRFSLRQYLSTPRNVCSKSVGFLPLVMA